MKRLRPALVAAWVKWGFFQKLSTNQVCGVIDFSFELLLQAELDPEPLRGREGAAAASV